MVLLAPRPTTVEVPADATPASSVRRRLLTTPAFVAGLLLACVGIGAVATRSPLLVVLFAGALLFAVQALWRPHIATLLVVALVYGNVVVVAVRVHGVPETAQYLIALVLAVPIADRFLRRREPIVVTGAAAFAALFLVAQIASTLLSRDPARAMEGLEISVFEGVALFLLVVNAIVTPGVLKKCAWIVLLIGGALGFLAIADAATGYDSDFGGFAQAGSEPRPVDPNDPFADAPTPRVGGPIGETNRFAQTLLIAVGIGVALTGLESNAGRRRVAGGATGLGAIGVVLTFSRGAAVALVLIVLAAVAMKALRPKQLVVPAVALLVVLGAVPEYRDRITSITHLRTATQRTVNEGEGDGSIRSRATENLAALYVFLDHPIVGVGPDLFPSYYPDYAKRVGIRVKPGEREAHNLFLDIASETGAFGLAAFAGLIAASVAGLRRARRSDDADLVTVATGLLLAVVGYLVSGVFLHFSFIRYFWLLIGLAGATAALASQARRRARG